MPRLPVALVGPLVLALAAPPAFAAPGPAASPAPIAAPAAVGMTPIALRDPWMAAALSGGAPVAMLAVSPLLAGWPLVFFPLATGAGQVYAGDPARGALVGVGAYAVTIGTTLGASAFLQRPAATRVGAPASGSSFTAGFGNALGEAIGNAVIAIAIGAVATAAYGGFAAWDAYGVAERANAAVRLEPVVTEAARAALPLGLAYEEAARRLGRPGAEVRFVREGGRSRATYRWANLDGSWAEATFEDGKLVGSEGHQLR